MELREALQQKNSEASLQQALEAWREFLSPAYVDDAPETLSVIETATFATSTRVAAVIRPGTRADVQACVRVANEYGIRLYPVSTGKNWGFGSAVPTCDGCVILHLGRMNRIVDFDEELAYITVEPGVTFRQVHAFLGERGSSLFANTTGASPDTSLIGNALERGDGVGPYGDRWRHVCNVEAVLPTGEVMQTGFGRFAGASTTHLFRWGVGPHFDGLFSQSNLGIVTQLTFWLHPVPRVMQSFRFAVSGPGSLIYVLDTLRQLRLEGTLTTAFGLWNDYRFLSTHTQYPWMEQGGRTPLTRSDLERLKREHGLEPATWYGMGTTYAGTAALADAVQQRVTDALRDHVDLLAFSRRERGNDPAMHTVIRDGVLQPPTSLDDASLDYLEGTPHSISLRSMYWRKRSTIPDDIDPGRDGCGVRWNALVLPLRGASIVEAATVVEEIFVQHGFEPMLVFLAHQERTTYFYPLLLYDRDLPGEDERAQACEEAIRATLARLGHLPYRLGIQSMNALPHPIDDYNHLLSSIKRALDPNDVLAPGRYDFRSSRPDRAQDTPPSPTSPWVIDGETAYLRHPFPPPYQPTTHGGTCHDQPDDEPKQRPHPGLHQAASRDR